MNLPNPDPDFTPSTHIDNDELQRLRAGQLKVLRANAAVRLAQHEMEIITIDVCEKYRIDPTNVKIDPETGLILRLPLDAPQPPAAMSSVSP